MITGKSKRSTRTPKKEKKLYTLMSAESFKNCPQEGTYAGKAYSNYQHPVNSYLKHSKNGGEGLSKMVVVEMRVVGKPNITRRITLK